MDDLPPFSKEEPLEAIMEYVRLQVADGKDMSWFTYDMLPDTLDEEEPRKKRKKKSSDKEKMKSSKRKKEEDKENKQREIHLKAYTNAPNRGKSGSLTSSVILSSSIDNSSISTTTSVLLKPTTTPQTIHNQNSPLTLSSDSDPISQNPSSPSSEELPNLQSFHQTQFLKRQYVLTQTTLKPLET